MASLFNNALAGVRPGVTLILAFFLCVSVANQTLAQESREAYQLPAVRVEERPEIDGVLDEALWASAAVIDEFIQQEPDEGAPSTERTEVRIVYDGGNLYLGVRAFDPGADRVIATEMRRDANRILDEDNFQVILDTFMAQTREKDF